MTNWSTLYTETFTKLFKQQTVSPPCYTHTRRQHNCKSCYNITGTSFLLSVHFVIWSIICPAVNTINETDCIGKYFFLIYGKCTFIASSVCVCERERESVCVCVFMWFMMTQICTMTWLWQEGYYKENVVYEDNFSVPIIQKACKSYRIEKVNMHKVSCKGYV